VTCKAEQASHLYQVDHLAQIVFFLEQAQYQIDVESRRRQQVNDVRRAPKEINPIQQANPEMSSFQSTKLTMPMNLG